MKYVSFFFYIWIWKNANRDVSKDQSLSASTIGYGSSQMSHGFDSLSFSQTDHSSLSQSFSGLKLDTLKKYNNNKTYSLPSASMKDKTFGSLKDRIESKDRNNIQELSRNLSIQNSLQGILYSYWSVILLIYLNFYRTEELAPGYRI